MKIEEIGAFFHVPLDDEGVLEMETLDYIDTPSPRIREFSLPYRQFDLLYPLYHQLNAQFGILISLNENERMKKEDVPQDLEMAEAFKAQCTCGDHLERVQKLIEILAFAKMHGAMVKFWF